jgi:outer membrane lipoprotein-sorting protein
MSSNMVPRFYLCRLLLCLWCILCLGSISHAAEEREVPASNKVVIGEIEQYLNSIRTFSTHFTQTDSSGNVSYGTFHMMRPGYIKWQYEDGIAIIGYPGKVIYYDPSLDEVTYINADDVHGSFLASEDIKFGRNINVKSVQKGKHYTELVIFEEFQGEKDPQQIILRFENQPLQLCGMVIFLPQGDMVSLEFYNSDVNISLDKKMFEFKNPKFFRSHIK